MADMISMGIAPLVFIFCSYQMQIIGDFYNVIVIAGIFLLYLFCSVIRLASFYLMKNDEYFIGLPASAATIILVVLVSINVSLLVIMISVIILSIFLLSSIQFPKPKKIMNVVAAVLIILAIIIGDRFNFLFLYLLLIGIILYTIGGSISIYLKKNNSK
jgi:CDP-diacylglycerol--serine O-phosphatidyltransferase